MNLEQVTLTTCLDSTYGPMVIIYLDNNTYVAFKIDVPMMEKLVSDLQSLIAKTKDDLEAKEQ